MIDQISTMFPVSVSPSRTISLLYSPSSSLSLSFCRPQGFQPKSSWIDSHSAFVVSIMKLQFTLYSVHLGNTYIWISPHVLLSLTTLCPLRMTNATRTHTYSLHFDSCVIQFCVREYKLSGKWTIAYKCQCSIKMCIHWTKWTRNTEINKNSFANCSTMGNARDPNSPFH